MFTFFVGIVLCGFVSSTAVDYFHYGDSTICEGTTIDETQNITIGECVYDAGHEDESYRVFCCNESDLSGKIGAKFYIDECMTVGDAIFGSGGYYIDLNDCAIETPSTSFIFRGDCSGEDSFPSLDSCQSLSDLSIGESATLNVTISDFVNDVECTNEPELTEYITRFLGVCNGAEMTVCCSDLDGYFARLKFNDNSCGDEYILKSSSVAAQFGLCIQNPDDASSGIIAHGVCDGATSQQKVVCKDMVDSDNIYPQPSSTNIAKITVTIFISCIIMFIQY